MSTENTESLMTSIMIVDESDAGGSELVSMQSNEINSLVVVDGKHHNFRWLRPQEFIDFCKSDEGSTQNSIKVSSTSIESPALQNLIRSCGEVLEEIVDDYNWFRHGEHVYVAKIYQLMEKLLDSCQHQACYFAGQTIPTEIKKFIIKITLKIKLKMILKQHLEHIILKKKKIQNRKKKNYILR